MIDAFVPLALTVVAIFVGWKMITIAIKFALGRRLVDRLNHYGGGDLRRDREPSWFGRRRR